MSKGKKKSNPSGEDSSRNSDTPTEKKSAAQRAQQPKKSSGKKESSPKKSDSAGEGRKKSEASGKRKKKSGAAGGGKEKSSAGASSASGKSSQKSSASGAAPASSSNSGVKKSTSGKGRKKSAAASSGSGGAKEKRAAADKSQEKRGGSAPSPAAGGRKSGNYITGTLSVTARGFGFVTVDDGPDIFIPLENMGTGMDGDTVTAEVIRQVPGKKPVGKVIKVTEPAVKDLVGVFHRTNKGAHVYPEDERGRRPLEIPEKHVKPQGADRAPEEGQFVLVRRQKWEDPRENPAGKIIEILGSPEDPEIDTLIVAKSQGLRTEFPKDVLLEAEKLSLPPMKKEKKRREDLRQTLCFTIDPESAKDFDDAVSLEQREDGIYELGVHIADVSHFVTEGSALDREALERGTSVYFVNKVIPMLPEKLSNDLCSLRENEDRLAFSVIMEIDSRGGIRDYRITESIIRSNRRFSYREVEEIIEGRDHPYAQTVHQMMMLSLVLRRAREEQGSIDFDIPVPLISLDEHGIPHEVRPSERIDANRMIEEFMLAANLTVARHMVRRNRQVPAKPGGGAAGGGIAAAGGGTASDRDTGGGTAAADNSAESGGAGGGSGSRSPAPTEKEGGGGRGTPEKEPWPFVYRVHEKPDENEVRDFLDLLGRLGINYRVPGELEPEDYRKILAIVENLEFKDFAEKVALRSMTKAVYSTDNIGHFGLAFDAYTHFTSPIRRYPDLLVHRLLKKYAAEGTRPPAAGTKAELQKICEQCSQREITAVEAEREHTKIKAMEFLAGKVGETYDGVIAGITSFGFFVELNHYLIEGLVHVSELRGDRYEFDKDNYTLTGERTGTTYRLGDPVRVTIKKVSVADRKADFILAEEPE